MRHPFATLLLPMALLFGVGLASAQPGPGPRGAGPAASGDTAPRMGMGMMGRGRFGPDNTAGWAMMSPAEREAHRERMASFKNEPECRAYQEEHHKTMAERAKERGRTLPTKPRRDACAGLAR